MRKQSGTLHRVADPATPQMDARFRNRFAEHANRAAIRGVHGVDQLKQRGLSTAALSNYRGRLSFGDSKVDVLENPIVVEALGHAMHLHGEFAHRTPPMDVAISMCSMRSTCSRKSRTRSGGALSSCASPS